MSRCSRTLRRSISVVLGALLLVSHPVFSADYELLTDLGSSAETIGRGNVEGFNESAGSIFENPATLARIQNASVGLFMTTLMDEVYYKNVSLAGRTPFGVIGFGYAEASVFDIATSGQDSITKEFYQTGSFDYRDAMMKFSYAMDLVPDISFGASLVQYFRSFSTIRATGANFDLGILYSGNDYQLSGFVRNFAAMQQVNFDFGDGTYASESLPVEYVISGKADVNRSLGLVGSLKSRSSAALMSAGLLFRPREFEALELSAGYRQYRVLDHVRGGISLGIALNLMGVKAAYAFEKIEDHPQYDNKSYFSVSINM